MVDKNDIIVVVEGVGGGVRVTVHDVRLRAAVIADVDHTPNLSAVLQELRLPPLGFTYKAKHPD